MAIEKLPGAINNSALDLDTMAGWVGHTASWFTAGGRNYAPKGVVAPEQYDLEHSLTAWFHLSTFKTETIQENRNEREEEFGPTNAIRDAAPGDRGFGDRIGRMDYGDQRGIRFNR
jgi:hypothetical protein